MFFFKKDFFLLLERYDGLGWGDRGIEGDQNGRNLPPAGSLSKVISEPGDTQKSTIPSMAGHAWQETNNVCHYMLSL